MITPFDEAVDELPVPVPPVVAQTLSLLYHLMQGDPESFQGACHTLTAIAHVLLTEQGVETVPCWGDVVHRTGPFDHSWLEIEGEIHDLAISNPHEAHLKQLPVVAGRSLSDGKPPALVYGASPATYGGNIAIGDPDQERLKRGSLTEYLDLAESHGLELWALIVLLGRKLEVPLERQTLQRKYSKVYWTIRDQVPVPPDMLTGWRVLH